MNVSGPQPRGARPHVVLAGGGHAHVHVVAALARAAREAVSVTLVSREAATPYSGMLPGVVAGLYSAAEAHIDLPRLCAASGARFVEAEATGIDRTTKRLMLRGREPMPYDVLSLDVGITPALDAIAGAAEHAIAVKPIGRFLTKFAELKAACARPGGPRRIAIVGGGAGGVELALALRHGLHAALNAGHADALRFTLVTEGEILASHNARVRRAFRRILGERNVMLREGATVARISADALHLESREAVAADAVLVTTQAAAPRWFAGTGLAHDTGGFIAVGPTLQSLNDPDIFAAGDCAGLVGAPRPKAGVFAVRAGPPLAANILRHTRGETLRAWRPQAHHLALISTGEPYAVASWGPLKAEGRWLWTLKSFIDRRWIGRYRPAV